MRGLVWFKEDLRTEDNMALFNAAKSCQSGVVGLYIIDTTMWKKHLVANCRVEFILRGLKSLSDELRKLNIPLLIIKIKDTKDISTEIFKIIKKVKAKELFFNRQYEINESKRDLSVMDYLAKNKITCHTYDDQLILPPGSVLTKKGEYFKVFTAFKNAWYSVFYSTGLKLLPAPKKQNALGIKSSSIPKELSGFHSSIDPSLWPAGEKEAKKRLQLFIKKNLVNYDTERDFPFDDATSRLSPYLAAGMISPRVCFMSAFRTNESKKVKGKKGAIIWMSELIWRDFFKTILISTPRVSRNKPFRLETDKLPWKYNEKHLQAWQQGKTGIPIVDAAMRQLNTTGWMHNRLRMITAMFFAKNLFLDWRIGEAYFMNKLIDGDLAANNGNWQWCASTGVDAVPYFRIFNPIRQSEKYDPKGLFIRKFCPELIECNNKSIHDPYNRMVKMNNIGDYPQSIIDLDISRKSTIRAFKTVLKLGQ